MKKALLPQSYLVLRLLVLVLLLLNLVYILKLVIEYLVRALLHTVIHIMEVVHIKFHYHLCQLHMVVELLLVTNMDG